MATVTLDSGSARLDNADTWPGTTWTAELGGSAEADYHYQGNFCISCQVKTSEQGLYFTAPSGTAYNGTPNRVWLAKIVVTNKDALDGNGVVLRIGSSSTAYYYYNTVFTNLTYPIVGGWQLVPLDPNISGYGRTASGSPNLGSVTYYGVRCDCNATSKAPNLGCDAIDYIGYGSGLILTGTSGTFGDFVTYDEDTVGNRYGIVSTRGGILYIISTLIIGSSTATTFTGTNRVLVFSDGRFGTGFSGLKCDLQNASTTIAWTNCTFIGRGAYGGFGGTGGTNDTRPVLNVSGTSGSFTITGSSFQSFNTITLNAATTVSSSNFISSVNITPAGASIDGCVFDKPDVANGTAHMLLASGYYLDDITNSTFNSLGTGHAIEIQQTGEHNLVGVEFNNYGSDGSTGAAIRNNSGGAVTINVAGAASPTVYNVGASTTSIVQSINWYFEIQDQNGNVITSGAELRIYNTSNVELFGVENSDGTELYSFAGALVGTTVRVVVVALYYLYYTVSLEHPATSNSADAPVILTLIRDRVYDPVN